MTDEKETGLVAEDREFRKALGEIVKEWTLSNDPADIPSMLITMISVISGVLVAVGMDKETAMSFFKQAADGAYDFEAESWAEFSKSPEFRKKLH